MPTPRQADAGERVTIAVELLEAIAIEPGMRFAIRESRTIGAGVASLIRLGCCRVLWQQKGKTL